MGKFPIDGKDSKEDKMDTAVGIEILQESRIPPDFLIDLCKESKCGFILKKVPECPRSFIGNQFPYQ